MSLTASARGVIAVTNREYLDYLAHEAPDQLTAWFESEHVDATEMLLLAESYRLERDSLREQNRAMAVTIANIREQLEDDGR